MFHEEIGRLTKAMAKVDSSDDVLVDAARRACKLVLYADCLREVALAARQGLDSVRITCTERGLVEVSLEVCGVLVAEGFGARTTLLDEADPQGLAIDIYW